jgi:hypothetical protein
MDGKSGSPPLFRFCYSHAAGFNTSKVSVMVWRLSWYTCFADVDEVPRQVLLVVVIKPRRCWWFLNMFFLCAEDEQEFFRSEISHQSPRWPCHYRSSLYHWDGCIANIYDRDKGFIKLFFSFFAFNTVGLSMRYHSHFEYWRKKLF